MGQENKDQEVTHSKGKILEGHWDMFFREVVQGKEHLGERGKQTLRDVFFAGAFACISSIVGSDDGVGDGVLEELEAYVTAKTGKSIEKLAEIANELSKIKPSTTVH